MQELPVKSENGEPQVSQSSVLEQSVSSDATDTSAVKAATPRRSVARFAVVVLGMVLIGGLVAYWNWPSPVVDVELRKKRIAESKGTVEVDPVSAKDKALAEKIVGTWFQVEYGKKTLTIFPDGKAKMVMEPAGLIALTFGSRIDAEMYWSVKDGYIDYGINGGTPADKLELAKKSFGDFWHEKIVTLNDKTLILMEQDNDESKWERLSDDESAPSSEVPSSDS